MHPHPNRTDYTSVSAWFAASIEYVTWLSDAANFTIKFIPWSPNITESQDLWQGLLEMIEKKINGTETTAEKFYIEQSRRKHLDFAGEYVLTPDRQFLYVIVPDEKYGVRTSVHAQIFQAFSVLGGNVWLLGCLSLLVISLILSATAKLFYHHSFVQSVSRYVELLFRTSLGMDSEKLELHQNASASLLVFVWSLLSLLFVSVYSGGVMSVTQVVPPYVPAANNLDG